MLDRTAPTEATLSDMAQAAAPPALVDDFEAARLLAISRASLHRLRSAGKFGPAPVRLGRSVRYRRAEVLEWAEAGCPDFRNWQAIRASQARRRQTG